MRKLLIWSSILVFCVFCLIVSIQCKPLIPDPNIILKGLEETLKELPPPEEGWVVIDQDGYIWEYWTMRGDVLVTLGRCEYTYMRVSGVEIWRGTYHWSERDLYMGSPIQAETEGLHECTEWIMHHAIGDYYVEFGTNGAG